MAQNLRALTGEYANAPGRGLFILTGVPITGCAIFGDRFVDGDAVVYLATDGKGAYESGSGIFNTGASNTISRGHVIENHIGTFQKVNFAGRIQLLCAIPAPSMAYLSGGSAVNLAGILGLVPGGLNVFEHSGGGSSLTIINPGNSGEDGAQIRLHGTTYDAFIQVAQSGDHAGEVQIRAGDRTTIMLGVDQSGNGRCDGTMTGAGLVHASAFGVSGHDLVTWDQFTSSSTSHEMPAGLMQAKWGSATSQASGVNAGVAAITFSPAFTTMGFIAMGIPVGGSANTFINGFGVNRTGVTFETFDAVAGVLLGSVAFDWLAIGY